jgi:serine/threonine protein kinase
MPDPSSFGPPPSLPALDARYSIGAAVGGGGKALVYLAEDRLLGRRAAIKVFRSRAESPEALREQETEAQLVAALNHHALTTLFDAGIDASDPEHPQVYLVMEYMAGGDLRELLKHGALSWIDACWLGLDISEALDYLHGSGFIHRDIKPANILLNVRDSKGRLRGKLTDFGIAAMVGRPQTEEFVTGTAAYLSPEQVEGADATEASDVYSLGLVLLEAITGRVEFPGNVERSAFARLDRDPAVPADLPEPVRTVLRGMLRRDPTERTAPGEAASAFQELLIDEIVRRRGVRVEPVDLDAEEQRLAAARRYNILGTPPEETFDSVTRLATKLMNAPVALISIIDSDRVWLKSHQGFEADYVDRNTSFCAVTNPGTGAWTIPDALEDPRTALNPVVIGDPNVRSYAAAPLTTSDGHNLGSICVYDYEPRQFDAESLETLTDLANVVMRELELRLASRRAIFDRD